MGLIGSNLDTVKDTVGLLEDDIHLLERAAAGLGEEEVDRWENECVTGRDS